MNSLSALQTERTPSRSFSESKNELTEIQLRARALLKLREMSEDSNLEAFRYRPTDYIAEKLGWTPWSGTGEEPGQAEILEHYALALRQQHERAAFEKDELTEEDLTCWKPGEVIQNWIRVEAGHTVGKTCVAAGMVSHFFDTCTPSITYAFAPSHQQINDLLFKEIRLQRAGTGLPGRVLETPEMKLGPGHFVKGRATNNAHGKGSERVQGQHGKYLLFVLDEAEGIPDFVFDAVTTMASGGIVIVLLLANPRTRTSRFHKLRLSPWVKSFRISCVHHPNVQANKEIVPGAVRRDYVEMKLQDCEQVYEHNSDQHTFELPWRPGEIWRPSSEFCWRVLGVPPADGVENVFCPLGRFEAACSRPAPNVDSPFYIRFGIDAARDGEDEITIWERYLGTYRLVKSFQQADTGTIGRAVKDRIKEVWKAGVRNIQVRVDAGGGFGAGVTDWLRADAELTALILSEPGARFDVVEVHFNGRAYDRLSFFNFATEMYFHVGESLKTLRIENPPSTLQGDICERHYDWKNRGGVEVKYLLPKDKFKKEHGRSPDHGDGVALAGFPDYLLNTPPDEQEHVVTHHAEPTFTAM